MTMLPCKSLAVRKLDRKSTWSNVATALSFSSRKRKVARATLTRSTSGVNGAAFFSTCAGTSGADVAGASCTTIFSSGGGGEVIGISAGRKNRSEEHTSELQSRFDIVCRLRLEKKNKRGKESERCDLPW